MVLPQIVADILRYIGVRPNSRWYLGIATNPRDRLFNQHNVSETNGRWIYRDAGTEQNARDTEAYLLRHYSFKGGVGGGSRPCSVYAYEITSSTVE